MLEFKPIELKDREIMAPYISHEDSNQATASFINMYIWDPAYRKTWAIVAGKLVMKAEFTDKLTFTWPVGPGDLKQCIDKLKEYSKNKGQKLTIIGILRKDVEILNTLFADEFEISTHRASYEYIYSAQKLATLSGKKLHSKRNHIHRFEALGQWELVPIDTNNLSECIEFKKIWSEKAKEGRNIDASEEKCALNRAFEDFDTLGFDGGILYLNGDITAFTIGSRLNNNTFDMHFEKADSDIPGAYPMINREFVRYILQKYPNIEFINREDDMGLENLRKAKLSYYPDILLEKYTATWK